MTIKREDESSASGPQGEPEHLGEHNGFEIYPMPFFATLAVDDPAGVARWYEQALGFGIMFQGPGPLVHVRRRKYQDVLLVGASAGRATSAGGPLLSFNATGEIEELAARAKAAPSMGCSAVEGPIDTPWNTRDLRVTDPAGHRLVFTAHRADASAEDKERWKQIFDASKKR